MSSVEWGGRELKPREVPVKDARAGVVRKASDGI